jgi:hypothetical protein
MAAGTWTAEGGDGTLCRNRQVFLLRKLSRCAGTGAQRNRVFLPLAANENLPQTFIKELQPQLRQTETTDHD